MFDYLIWRVRCCIQTSLLHQHTKVFSVHVVEYIVRFQGQIGEDKRLLNKSKQVVPLQFTTTIILLMSRQPSSSILKTGFLNWVHMIKLFFVIKPLRSWTYSIPTIRWSGSNRTSCCINSSDGPMVRASAAGAVDLGLIPSRVKPMTLKLVFTATLLDAQPASLFVVPLRKALNGTALFWCGRDGWQLLSKLV